MNSSFEKSARQFYLQTLPEGKTRRGEKAQSKKLRRVFFKK